MTTLNTRTLLFFVFLVTAKLTAANVFTLNLQAKQGCDAGDAVVTTKDSVGNSKYKVLYAKILWVNDEGKITGMVACKVPTSAKCVVQTAGDYTTHPYLFLAVTLKRTSFEDQNVHYMYNDDAKFQLSKLGAPPKDGTLHEINNFLYVESASYTDTIAGKSINVKFHGAPCQQHRDKSLISGHGYFVARMNVQQDNLWHNMYYNPPNTGYWLRAPK